MKKRFCKNEEHERLINSSQQSLRAFIFVICPNFGVAEDILQETNRVLWEKKDEFQSGTDFLAWARKVAQFQTLSFIKRNKSRSWLSFDSELVHSLAKTAEESEKSNEIESERSICLAPCIAELNKTDRELVYLKYEKRMMLKEISETTGRSQGALKQAFMRIRRILRECVERKTIQSSEK